jgi:hypothetical protein
MSVAGLESYLKCCALVKNLLEPKLIHLMDCDEQEFIMLGSVR